MFRKLLLPRPYFLEPRAVRSPSEHDTLKGHAGKAQFLESVTPRFFNDCFLEGMMNLLI